LALLGDDRVEMTDEQVGRRVSPPAPHPKLTSAPQNRLVARKIDLNILPPLCWVYFLQILDKSCVGYAANFGLQTETVSDPFPGL
jgi:hypothetical protein